MVVAGQRWASGDGVRYWYRGPGVFFVGCFTGSGVADFRVAVGLLRQHVTWDT